MFSPWPRILMAFLGAEEIAALSVGAEAAGCPRVARSTRAGLRSIKVTCLVSDDMSRVIRYVSCLMSCLVSDDLSRVYDMSRV